MRLRLLLGALLSLVLGGCSLVLDFSEEGHPCDDKGGCLAGYVCDGTHTCVKAGSESAQCKPACGAFQKCEKSQCVPVCDGRGCAAGQACSAGKCQAVAASRTLGSPCESRDDCADGSFCLLPYGTGTGVCTKTCESDAACGSPAPRCRSFRSSRSEGVKLCVAESFLDCSKESECAASGLSCGVYLAPLPNSGAEPLNVPVTACRARVQADSGIGDVCGPAIRCTNGLCVQSNARGGFTCTTPCDAVEDCGETIRDDKARCVEVTVKLPYGPDLAKTRPKLCVPGGRSQLQSCDVSADVCTADGPLCTLLPGGPGYKQCTTLCGDGPTAEKCPSGQRCVSADGKMVCAQ